MNSVPNIYLGTVTNFWNTSLHETCLYSELFWSLFFCIRTEYGEILFISPYSVRMRENTGQNNSKYGHFLRSASGRFRCHWWVSQPHKPTISRGNITFGVRFHKKYRSFQLNSTTGNKTLLVQDFSNTFEDK